MNLLTLILENKAKISKWTIKHALNIINKLKYSWLICEFIKKINVKLLFLII